MISEHQLNIIRTVAGGFTLGNYLITFCLNIGWALHCIRQCWIYVKRYRVCKRTPDLHPIYRDVQYLSRQRKLYNLETHIVKYILAILCLFVDISGTVLMVICILLSDPHSIDKYLVKLNETQESYPNCHIHSLFERFYFVPIYVVLYNSQFLLLLLVFLFLCILTRYLTARYLNHSFRRTLVKYLTLIALQCFLVAICSTLYTFIFSLLLFPFLFIVNWVILLKDNLALSRVLASNLREIELHSCNKALYREQYSAYKFYRLFQKCLLLSLFLFVTTIILFFLMSFITLIVDSFCLLNIIYGFKYYPNLRNPLFNYENYEIMVQYIIFALYSLSTSLPLLSATLTPLILACVNRYRTRHSVYRFNYENIQQPLLRGSQ